MKRMLTSVLILIWNFLQSNKPASLRDIEDIEEAYNILLDVLNRNS